MIKEFMEDRKIRLLDSPANVAITVIAALIVLGFNVWGMILPVICCFAYGLAEADSEIYMLLPESGEERKRRLLSFALMELLLIMVIVAGNMQIVRLYNSSRVVNSISNLVIFEMGYFVFILHNMVVIICKNKTAENYSKSQLKENGNKRLRKLYPISIFLADKILAIQILFFAIDIVTKGSFLRLDIVDGCAECMTLAIVICSIISLVDIFVVAGGKV